MKPKSLSIALLVTVAVGGMIAFIVQGYRKAGGPDPHAAPAGSPRLVLVGAEPSHEVSRPGRPLRTGLIAGSLPPGRTASTVLSDENCAPDAYGVSHCTNRIRMEHGAEMTVVHAHRMSEVPCLSPGERIMVQAA